MRKTCQKEKKKRPPKPYHRKVHIKGEVWTYRVTNHCLQIANPDCSEKWKINMTDFTGMTVEALERASWKKTFPKIGPQDVKDYIEEKLSP